MATYGLRMFAEYETDHALLPLWPYAIEAEAPSTSRLPISPALRSDLETWNARWNYLAQPSFDEVPERDWNQWPDAVAWNTHGYELARRLRGELGNAVEIVYFDYLTDDDVVIA